MRLHIIEEDDEFPPLADAWEELSLRGDDLICYDSPLRYNLGVGDQIQMRFEDGLYIYIVEEVVRCDDMPACLFHDLSLAYSSDLLRLVTLRSVL